MLIRTRNRAFSLVEMLTVIGILAIVIAIIIPAVAGARRAARNADTRVLLKQVGDACSLFQTSERRLPGYFNASQMGDNLNATQFGFTGCENLMLDLIGGATTVAPNGTTVIAVGPGNGPQTQVNIDLVAMGSSTQTKTGAVTRGYFTMDSKRFVVQSGTGQRRPALNNNAQLPVLVDTFGSPLLAWIQDEVPSSGLFCATDKQTAASYGGARFYWASNAGFLDESVRSLGKLARSQSFALGGSILASNNTTPAPVGTLLPGTAVTRTLEAMLGNPASPGAVIPGAAPFPVGSRGPIVLQAAGADGVYCGREDKGGRRGYTIYAPNQDPFGGSLFDDIIQAAGH